MHDMRLAMSDIRGAAFTQSQSKGLVFFLEFSLIEEGGQTGIV